MNKNTFTDNVPRGVLERNKVQLKTPRIGKFANATSRAWLPQLSAFSIAKAKLMVTE